jgi:hypothetical protein
VRLLGAGVHGIGRFEEEASRREADPQGRLPF